MESLSSYTLEYDFSIITPDRLKLAISHNKFGGLFFKGNQYEKAISHFEKAKEAAGNVAFTNIYQNLGNLYAQQNKITEAIKYYQTVIEFSPYNEKNKELIKDEHFYNQLINSREAYVDAYTNLAVMYLKLNDNEKGLYYCQKATDLDPENYVAIVNLGDIMRQVGKQNEAIEFTWNQIVKYTREKTEMKDYVRPTMIDCQKLVSQTHENDVVNILCVKWGKKYGADYVNKLFSGVKRNTRKEFVFYCFTDDQTGLHPEIVPIALKESWGGWWGKATLFSKEYGIKGRKVFIDLDTVITGCLDDILSFPQPFGITRADLFQCERENKEGYNSSILIWNNDDFESIYSELKKNFSTIMKYIVRFDFWLEMMVKSPDFVQDSFTTQIVDYSNDCQDTLPDNSRIVCFPRFPKPHESNAAWIKEHWVDK